MAEASATSLDIPDQWHHIDIRRMSGILMVIGAPDTGKSTFSQYLYQRLVGLGKSAAYLDGDPGQSRLGPPTTMTLVHSRPGDPSFPPMGPLWRRFIGSVTPAGHMLNVLVGAARLIEAGKTRGLEAVVYDTSGLVDPSLGGLALKLAKIDLLQPAVVFTIQREGELQPLINPLRLNGKTQVIELKPSRAVQPRSQEARQAYRKSLYAQYFKGSALLKLSWMNRAILPAPHFSLNRLISLENDDGFVLDLGVVMDVDRSLRQVTVLTPLPSSEGVVRINIGDVSVDPNTFRDIKIHSS